MKINTITPAILTACLIMSFQSSSRTFDNGTVIEHHPSIIEKVSQLYGTDQTEAAKRLIDEQNAADAMSRIEADPPRGYAGSWYDTGSSMLTVALTHQEDTYLVRNYGARAVIVKNSLNDLNEKLQHLLQSEHRKAIHTAYIDLPKNLIHIEVTPGEIIRISEFISDIIDYFEINESRGNAITTSSYIRGAEGIRNPIFGSMYFSPPTPCSIGVATEEGFYTAGHFGYADHHLTNPSGTRHAEVESSTWGNDPEVYGATEDNAWVEASINWPPEAVINGYTLGMIDVPGKWA